MIDHEDVPSVIQKITRIVNQKPSRIDKILILRNIN